MNKIPNHVRLSSIIVVVLSICVGVSFISYAVLETTLQSLAWGLLLGLVAPPLFIKGVFDAVHRRDLSAATVISVGWFLLTIVFAWFAFGNLLYSSLNKSIFSFACSLASAFLFFSFLRWRKKLVESKKAEGSKKSDE